MEFLETESRLKVIGVAGEGKGENYCLMVIKVLLES